MNTQTQKTNFAGGPGPSLAVVLPKLETLPVAEQRQLIGEEELIEQGLQTITNSYVEIGRALDRIREQRLYRAKFGTFEEYCAERWARTARWARQRIEGARVAVNLLEQFAESQRKDAKTAGGAKVEVLAPLPMPATERVARALVPLAKEEQRYVWQEAVKASPTGKPTAVEVGAIVERREREIADGKERIPEEDLARWIPKATKILAKVKDRPVTVGDLYRDETAEWSYTNCGKIFYAMVARGLIKDGKLIGQAVLPNPIPIKTAGLTLGDKRRGEVMATLRWVTKQIKDLKETAESLGRFSGQAEYHRQIVVDHVECLREQFRRAGTIEDADPISQKVTKQTKSKDVTRIPRISTNLRQQKANRAITIDKSKRGPAWDQRQVIARSTSLSFLRQIFADSDVHHKLRAAARIRFAKLQRAKR